MLKKCYCSDIEDFRTVLQHHGDRKGNTFFFILAINSDKMIIFLFWRSTFRSPV